ncbi:HNH endonuclease [Mycoplasmopsis cynos]|nr:HNH endonuclease [Mycoplasmopsis felis]WQQ11358.1 HNH endonuclease [Mycoplasmopsis felis]
MYQINYIDLKKFEFNIETSNWNKNTNSSKFRGKIIIIFHKETLILYAYRIIIDECYIDLKTTKSWFESNNNNFKRREELFRKLNLKQEIRNHLNENKLVHIKPNEYEKLNIINDYLLNEYKSTIKNIKSLLSGNNPTGELKNHQNAPIIISESVDILEQNFSIFFENYSFFKENKYDFSIYFEPSNFNNLETLNYINLLKETQNTRIKNLIKNITLLLIKKTNDMGKSIIKEFHKLLNLPKINKLIQERRHKYYKNIKLDKHFVFEPINKKTTERAHIYPVSRIKEEVISKLINENKDLDSLEIQKKLDEISDINNYINLPSELHTLFDSNLFTYNEHSGMLQIYNYNEEIDDYYINWLKTKFNKIPDIHFNKERRRYFTLRNK